MKKIEKLGTQYGSWIVLKFDKIDPNHGAARWWCKCELCRRIYSVRGDALRSGRSTKCKSCARRLRCGRMV